MTDNFLPGTVFAGYRIERVLGRGGMGVVYLARHPRLPRYDALKVLPLRLSADQEGRARFLREAELAARLDHPNIVAVWDRGVERGYLWIAMQFVEGIDADSARRQARNGLDPALAVHIIGEAARGLDAAHRAGMLHRDVKPANLLLEGSAAQLSAYSGERPTRVYVSDFGIGRAVADAALTEPGDVVATLAYAAPERLTTEMIDHRVDVYGLGCALYELLTGTHPYPATSSVEMMTAHLHAPPPKVTDLVPGLPPDLDTVIARGLAKDPTHRYASCGELAAAAAAALAARPAAAGLEDRRPRRFERVRRLPRKVRVSASAGLVLLLVAAIVFGTRIFGDEAAAHVGPPTSMAASAPAPLPAWDTRYQYMIDAFPGFLPTSPLSTGYAGMRCSTKRIDPTAPDTTPAGVTALTCRGNGDPMDLLLLNCNTDRSPVTLSRDSSDIVDGDRQWQRPTGQGRMMWGTSTQLAGVRQGLLVIEFDDAARNFCELIVSGGTGQDLIDRWWQPSPL